MAARPETLFRLLKTSSLDKLEKSLTVENVNAPNPGGYSLLHQAVSDLNLEATRLLLNRGADVNRPDPRGSIVLHYAVDKLDRPMTELLLDAGANINHRGRRGFTPLRWAITRPLRSDSDYALIRFLLDRGANPWIEDDSGGSAVAWAETVHPELAEEMKARFPRPK